MRPLSQQLTVGLAVSTKQAHELVWVQVPYKGTKITQQSDQHGIDDHVMLVTLVAGLDPGLSTIDYTLWTTAD